MEIIKLAAIFVVMLVFLGFKKPLDLVVAGACILLALVFRMPVESFFIDVGRCIISYDTISMLLIIWFVMMLEGLMSQYGYMQKILDGFDHLFHSKKFNMISMPVIIGFLPSAGGALFSAPMVEKAAAGEKLSPERKAMINIYYRHTLEIFFPTYPGILMAASMTGLPLPALSLTLLPMATAVLVLGLVLARGVKRGEHPRHEGHILRRLWNAIYPLWPILLTLLCISLLKLEVWLSIAISFALLFIVYKTPVRKLPAIIKKSTRWRLLTMVLAVLIFKDLLYTSGAVDSLPATIGRLPIPPLLVFSLMSLFMGLFSAMAMSANAVVMPLAMLAIPEFGLAEAAFLHLAAYVGCQITPTHLCVPLSAEYFHADLKKVLLFNLPIYACIYGLGALLYIVIW